MKRALLGLVVFVVLLVAAGFGSLALQHVLSPNAQCLNLGGSWDGEAGQCVGSDYPLPE
ncbi:hypothetical protein [Devosia epidermidihirudinis]|uniref:hypothetical protein n=1 Tax=Devosia epidermidihirudinis TaxID=1293439 RepID=UPI000A6785B4|nr:hypothetical protein [Devosia epidermidihirudinis]